eukprot:scaffold15968_cov46-Cyclotella_meneghiniana.AAC.5
MPPKKKSKPANNLTRTTLSPLQRHLQACINHSLFWIYQCLHRSAEAKDCGVSATCTICACKSFTSSAALCSWMFVINALTLDPDAIQSIDGPIDIIVMLVHYKEGLCPLPAGTDPTGNYLTDTLNAVSFRFFNEAGPIDTSMFDGDLWVFFILKIEDEHHFLAFHYHQETGRYLILDAANPRQFQADPPTLVYLLTNGCNWLLSLLSEPFNNQTCSLHGFAYPVTGGRLTGGVLPQCKTPHELQGSTAFPIQGTSHTWIGQVPYNVRLPLLGPYCNHSNSFFDIMLYYGKILSPPYLCTYSFAVRDAPGWVRGFFNDLTKTGKDDAEVWAVAFDAGASTGTESQTKTV